MPGHCFAQEISSESGAGSGSEEGDVFDGPLTVVAGSAKGFLQRVSLADTPPESGGESVPLYVWCGVVWCGVWCVWLHRC
jgi:hypothetical protein